MANVDNQISIDIGLAVLCCVSDRGQTLSLRAIADVCDCSKTYIDNLEKSALKNLQLAIQSKLYLYDYLHPNIDLPIEQHYEN
ncbi:MAG: hypothetical protein COA63_010840 [Methylophaga sp.]|nr:hypothetical protein [Methylophaga sp.]